MTPLSIPMWIPQGIWVFGLLVFSVCCITLLIRGTYLVMKKRLDEASALIGNPSMEMEALTEAGLEITTESLSREGGDK
jgi:hypothetical protein